MSSIEALRAEYAEIIKEASTAFSNEVNQALAHSREINELKIEVIVKFSTSIRNRRVEAFMLNDARVVATIS